MDSLGDRFRRQPAGNADPQPGRSLTEAAPAKRNPITSAGVHEWQAPPREHRRATPWIGTLGSDPPQGLRSERVEPFVGFGTVELDPLKTERVADGDHLVEGLIAENTYPLSTTESLDPPCPFRIDGPRCPGHKDKTQKIGARVNGHLGVAGARQSTDLY
jgi:hypothetical protein